MYKFTEDGRSLATGTSWVRGQTVTPKHPLFEMLLAEGRIEEVKEPQTSSETEPEAEVVLEEAGSEPEEEEKETTEEDVSVALHSKTNAELRDMLEEQELPTSGNKDELVERLLDNGVE